MKTLNFYLFLLTALLCGAFLCTDSQARVCFATDPDCGNGGNFGNMDDLKQYDDACKRYGYTYENSCPAEYIKYICPYKSTWLKCCGKQFRYEGCIYPLEIDKSQVGDVVDGVTQYGKCGTRYACKCPDEYEISSEYAETNNCQPGGGYCLQSDGTTDTVKYKTCTCDEDIYTDVSSCKNNQTETSSCKDAQGTVRKKCHCDRGVYPYAACEYGPSIGAKTCIDSNSGREYYSRCKTAEEACRTYDEDDRDDHDGKGGFQHNDCSRIHNCTTKEQVWNPDSKKYEYLTSYNCILGEQCPYPVNPGLYKCVFDKASWCMSHGYTSTMTTKPAEGTKCSTPDGFVGTYSVCPGNDNNSLYYYTCDLPCEQEVRRAYSKGYLTLDAKMVGDDGSVVGYIRTDGSSRHLYLIGDITLPKTRIAKNANWANTALSSYDYASINGMYALPDSNMKYPDGSYMFSGCAKERETKRFYRPKIKWDGMMIGADNEFINKEMSDIAIDIYASNTSNGDGFGEKYYVSSPTWKNVTIRSDSFPWEAKISEYGHYFYINSNLSEILIRSGNTLTLTGDVIFDISKSCYGKDGNCAGQHLDFYTQTPSYMQPFIFHILESGVVKFQDATIDNYWYGGASWDGHNGSILFYNTKMKNSYASVGDLWFYLNIGLSNSTIRADKVRTFGYAASNTSRRFGGYSDISGWNKYAGAQLSRCRGIFIDDSSNLEMTEAGWMDNYTKIYVGWGATLKAQKPIMLNHQYQSLVCLDYGTVTVNNKSFGGYNKVTLNGNYGHFRWLGQDSVRSQTATYADTSVWNYKYDHGNSGGAYPCSTGGTCDGKCNSDFDANCNGTNCAYLCTGCVNCSYFGMGY